MSTKVARKATDTSVSRREDRASTNSTSSSKHKLPNKHQYEQKPLCHGRVKDLESMVPAQWWKTVFADAMYLKTDGDVVEDPEITREEIALLEADPDIKRIFLKGSNGCSDSDDSSVPDEPPPRILDLCCGQGRHSLHLVKEYPHLLLHGHDQSSFLISLAQERASFENVANQTVFTVGDCRQIPYADNTFDLVILMGNSFGYFSDEDGDKLVLKEIDRVLIPGGLLVLDLTDGGYMRANFAERSWEWVDDSTFVCRERQLSKDGLRLNSREIVTLTGKGVVRDQFYQERLYSREEIMTILIDAGLEAKDQVQVTESIITLGKDLSKRNEDLGMMEQRMLITAAKPVSLPDLATVKTLGVTNGLYVNCNGYSNGLNNGSDDLSSSNGHPNGTIRDSESPELRGPPPFAEITVLLGDPSQACVGKLNDTWNQEDMETRSKFLEAMHAIGYASHQIKILDKHSAFHKTLLNRPTEFVFNLCDEGFENDALKELHIPALLDILKIPYSGAGPNCLAFCFDKGMVNRTAEALGVPTPKEIIFLGDTATPAIKNMEKLGEMIEEKMDYPVFLKPTRGDNSLGITGRSIVRNRIQLDSYMNELRSLNLHDVLVQEYLEGTEYGIGMVGNFNLGFHFFPVLEIDYSRILERNLPPILGYESKWDPTSPYWSEISYKRAVLSPATESQLREYCIVLWERFGCRDYARFDFRCDRGKGDGMDGLNGTIKLLEVNPNPGWCWDGKLAYMGKLEGIEYKDVIQMILQASWLRLNRSPSASSSSSDQTRKSGESRVSH